MLCYTSAFLPTFSIEVQFEDFLWANSIFWTRALNIPLPHSYVFPGLLDEKQTKIGDNCGDSSPSTLQGNDITAKSSSGNDNPKSSDMESIWVEGLVPGIDFCNHNVTALATWEVDSAGHVIGNPSMYLLLVDKSVVKAGTEIYINYGNKGNETEDMASVMWGRTYRRRRDVRCATERAARTREEASTGG
ncbi:hypothetical protein GUJ93_ZPchr0006g45972 [Zizania palustris]|uniref:SET domain-containing protein n=1 Tax=Zizania palustris TaxID=103762 RepID=A0A8J5SYG7_ZIZPA|nr:hypothetical protein GUJ93_ZPchr0006g45972 [Zizania palustris]